MITITPVDYSGTLAAIDSLVATIQVLPKEPLERYGKTATDEMKEQHDRDAHAIQRYVNRTYYLTTSIGWDVARVSGGSWRLRMYAPPFYAEAVEYGTPKSAAYPFFWVEVYGHQPAALADMTKAFMDALGRHEKAVRGQT